MKATKKHLRLKEQGFSIGLLFWGITALPPGFAVIIKRIAKAEFLLLTFAVVWGAVKKPAFETDFQAASEAANLPASLAE